MNVLTIVTRISVCGIALLLSACASSGASPLGVLTSSGASPLGALTIGAPKIGASTTPASIAELTIDANGSRMPGLIYQAAGQGPHPTAIMLHGYPGNEKNLDLAQALRKADWNAVFFNYRGAWGAEGEFSFIGAEQDVQTAINYLQHADNSARLRVNPSQISLVGHSMGGHMAIAGILDNPSILCAVAHDGANMGARGKGLFNDKQSIKLWSDYSDTLFMLKGWSGKKAIAEISQHGSELDLDGRVASINQRPVHLIAADTDVIPIDQHIKPLYEALRNYSDKISYQLIDDDHSFSNSRDKLIDSTLRFLNKSCR
ncbi:MAG: dienelactone hydrolase [Arenicella sp.]|jgi:dienelactone hydrolase